MTEVELSVFLVEIQKDLVKDPGVLVNRVIWSPDGSLFGKLKSITLHGWMRNIPKILGVKRHVTDFSSLYNNRSCILKAYCTNMFLSWE